MTACIVISEKNTSSAIALANKYKIAEVRLDLCLYDIKSIKLVFQSHNNLIATFRHHSNNIIEKIRTLKYAIQYGAKYIDIEYELDDDLKSELIQFAQLYDAKIILSYHNYHETDNRDTLIKIINDMSKHKPQYIKIACKTNTENDAAVILSLYESYTNLIAFGIGENSKFSRIAAIELGAPFTYIYFGDQVNKLAEGMLSSVEFEAITKFKK